MLAAEPAGEKYRMKKPGKIIKLRDLGESLEILVGSLVAWCVPERRWDAIVRFYVATVIHRDLERVEWRLRKVAQLFGDRFDAPRRREIVVAHDQHRQRDHLQRFKELSPFGWHPSIRVRGGEHITAALAEGNGVILWLGRFAYGDVVTKKGLHQEGFRLRHLSRPQHAFTGSWFADRVISPIWLVPESRYLAERVVYHEGRPAPMAKRLYQCLQENQIVSITAGPESLSKVDVPFLGCRLRLATGPANLALMTGARLFAGLHHPQRGRWLRRERRATFDGFHRLGSSDAIVDHGRRIRRAAGGPGPEVSRPVQILPRRGADARRVRAVATRAGSAEPTPPASALMIGPVALDRDPVAAADLRPVVPEGVVLGRAVVPEGDRIGAPSEAAVELRRPDVFEEELEQGPALGRLHTDDLPREARVDEEPLAPGDRVAADHRVFGARIVAVAQALLQAIAAAVDVFGFVPRGQRRQEGLHLVRERLVGGVHAGEHGIAAALGHLGQVEDRAHRRRFVAADVGMPAVAGDMRWEFSSAWMTKISGMPLRRRGGRVNVQVAEAMRPNSLCCLERHLLIAQERPRRWSISACMNFIEGCLVERLGEIDAVDGRHR